MEVVVNGLPLFGGSQIAEDTTLVSALHCDGTPLRRAAAEDGVALTAAALRKSRTYPELVGPRARARLVVMGVEVSGRWAPETRTFLSLLALARARGESRLLQRRAGQAWRLRWGFFVVVYCRAGVREHIVGTPRSIRRRWGHSATP